MRRNRFVEDDLAGDPEAGALASNGQGPGQPCFAAPTSASVVLSRRRSTSAAGQRDAADPGENELSELGKYCTSCRAVT